MINSTSKKKQDRRETLYFWAFVTPLLLGLLLFVYIPIIWGFGLSLFEARNTVTPTEFVGLQNYLDLFSDDRFITSLK
ncbi:MAG: sugar ABC transporter permease, partial [Chloroflexi bacterium]